MGTILEDKYIHPEFTELPRKQENLTDPVTGKNYKTPSYYGRKLKFKNDVECYTELANNPTLVVNRQQSQYKPFTKKTTKLDRCSNQKVIKQMVHGKVTQLVVPCGKCSFCLHKRQNELILRARNEQLSSIKTIFVTLTINNEHLKYGTEKQGRLDYTDIQHFIKRLRSLYKSRKGCILDFSYLVCGEYGDTFSRPHYHIILFIKEDIDIVDFYLNYLQPSWQLGFIFPRPDRVKETDLLCTINSIAYATKYISKYDERGNIEYPQFIKWSNGFGKDYVIINKNIFKQYRDKNRISYTNIDKRGELKEYSVSLPIYYRKLVFSPAEQYLITESYLNSLQYKSQLSIMKDYVLYNHLRNMGSVYEQKSKEKLNARKAEKIRKLMQKGFMLM